ncbi:MAG: hypothetical protein LBE21_10560, partial [Pseudomonadales bacterium]|nr:hypothetical protein [Pseudomonadales bacterium]
MKNRFQIIFISIASTFIFGCASTGENLQRETALSIGENTSPEQVTISNVERSVTSVKWSASAPSGNYECSADDMVRRVVCTKQVLKLAMTMQPRQWFEGLWDRAKT